MALMNCDECDGKVSDKASACPHCGAPVATFTCDECDGKVSDKASACPHCGAPVNNETSAVPSAEHAASTTPEPQDTSDYHVWITSIGKRKIAVIKLVRAATRLGLKEAKDLVESTPAKVNLAGLSHDAAIDLGAQFEAIGAVVALKKNDEPVGHATKAALTATSEKYQAETKKAGLDVSPFVAGFASWAFGLMFAILSSIRSSYIAQDGPTATITAAILACLLLPPTRWLIEKIFRSEFTRTQLVMVSIAGVFIVLATTTPSMDARQTKAAKVTSKTQAKRQTKAAKVTSKTQAKKCTVGTWLYENPADRNAKVRFKKDGSYELFLFSQGGLKKHHSGDWATKEGFYSNTGEAYFGPQMSGDLTKHLAKRKNPNTNIEMMGTLCMSLPGFNDGAGDGTAASEMAKRVMQQNMRDVGMGDCIGALSNCKTMQITLDPNGVPLVFKKKGH